MTMASTMPSPFTSATATDTGLALSVDAMPVWNVPSPLPSNALSPCKLTTTRSGLLSPFTRLDEGLRALDGLVVPAEGDRRLARRHLGPRVVHRRRVDGPQDLVGQRGG